MDTIKPACVISYHWMYTCAHTDTSLAFYVFEPVQEGDRGREWCLSANSFPTVPAFQETPPVLPSARPNVPTFISSPIWETLSPDTQSPAHSQGWAEETCLIVSVQVEILITLKKSVFEQYF